MKNQKTKSPQVKDRHLDVPAEANRDKHVRFTEEPVEVFPDVNTLEPMSKEDKKRRDQWIAGVEEGKQMREK
ncbi:hypothetical protein SAMN05421788_105190 [Filimonas lacunae]|uniref:Uncharacterized protein n=1 Tax=Filimonas lacunae TaxID=477680 RepID=A0A173MCS3_9BACT|nr:hypothetical protein [Filimonas lacunae]BAV05355.1 hypothetical protein FLA_1362 [Filimonas lacunae]SIT21790.1 hypothetical protein SAMN05421788_105190 [Filimonas lacunae]